MKKLDIFSLIACRDVLKAARRRIESGADDYICHAIMAARVKGSTRAVKQYLTRWVNYALQGAHTYSGWLTNNYCWMNNTQLREGRKQWLDWMINQLETEIEEQRA